MLNKLNQPLANNLSLNKTSLIVFRLVLIELLVVCGLALGF